MKIILIYPPDRIGKKYFYAAGIPLSLAILNNCLISKGFKNIEIVDCKSKNIKSFLRALHNSKLSKLGKFSCFVKLSNILIPRINKKKEFLSLSGNTVTEGITIPLIVKKGKKYPISKKSSFYKFLKKKIIENNSDVVGFSVMSYNQLLNTIRILKIIKSVDKGRFTVLGGPIITKHINDLIKNKSLLPIIDAFVEGDGGESLFQLLLRLKNGKNLSKIPNLYYNTQTGYKKSNTSINTNGCIIPNYNFLDLDYLTLKLSKGCPWSKCSFCTYGNKKLKYNCIDVGDAIKLIKSMIMAYKPKKIVFADDTLPASYLKKLSERLIEEKIVIEWECFGSIMDREFSKNSTLDLMKKSGCSCMRFGLESMSPRILKLMNKKHDAHIALEVLKSFKKSKIDLILYVMFGFPTETREEANITLDFLKNNKSLYRYVAQIQQFCLEENTYIYNNPQKFCISKIYANDNSHTKRLGHKYEVKKGMNPREAKLFTSNAIKQLADKCSNAIIYYLNNY